MRRIKERKIISAIVVLIFLAGMFFCSSWCREKYLMTTFVSSEMELRVYASKNGIDFKRLSGVDYRPGNGNQTVRDPSIISLGEYYYIIYTAIGWESGNVIGMCRTKNFAEFEELPFLTAGDFYKVWAPAFYTEGDATYLIFNASRSETEPDFQSYIVQYDARLHTVSDLEQIKGLPENVIDTQIYKVNNQYYLFYKNEDTKYIELAEASDLHGEYTVIGKGDWAGWGNTLEGPALIEMESGMYRLYMDQYEEGQIYYSDSYDLKKGWTVKQKVTPEKIAHPDVKMNLKYSIWQERL